MEEMEAVQDTSVQEDTQQEDLFLESFDEGDTSEDEREYETSDVEEDVPAESVEEEKKDLTSITVNGKTVELSHSDLIAAAQKGMDYDRIRDELHRYRSEIGEAAKKSGMSVKEFINSAVEGFRAAQEEEIKQAYISEGYDDETAELLAQKDLQIKAKQKAETEEQAALEEQKTEDAKRQRDIERFLEINPNVSAEEIPEEVWADVNKGYTLTEAYLKYKVGKQDLELRAAQKNEENKARSAGSARTSKLPKQDAFLSEFLKD